MPQISLPEAQRYFFSPFIIAFCFCVYDPSSAKTLLKDFGIIPAVAALVAGVTIYYFYRFCIYNDLIMSFYDCLRRNENHRLFIMRRYNIPLKFIYSTRKANRILHELSDDDTYSSAMAKRQRPMRAGGVHLLYQSAICAFAFGAFSIIKSEWPLATVFFLMAFVQIYTAARMDFEYEEEELLLVQSMQPQLDKAAAKLKLAPTTAARDC
jgi:hypothetical protein